MIEKITKEKAKELSVSSLPTRPNAPAAFGGMGFSSTDMKEAFDVLTLYVIEKYNQLIDSVYQIGDDSLSAAIPTDILPEHTLSKMFEDVGNGNFASYLSVGSCSLATSLAEINETLEKIKEKLKI